MTEDYRPLQWVEWFMIVGSVLLVLVGLLVVSRLLGVS